MAFEIPNLKIKALLESLIDIIRDDYATKYAATLESESWLYRVFHGVTYGTYDFYEQAKEVLINRDKNNPRRLEVHLGYNLEKPENPTIHINVPSESLSSNTFGVNAIGMNHDTNDYSENDDGTVNENYSRSFNGSYELMVVSVNEFESELIYRFLQALFISANDTLVHNFGEMFSFSGKQLIPNLDIFPKPTFIRVLGINLSYKITVPQFPPVEYLDDVTFEANNISAE